MQHQWLPLTKSLGLASALALGLSACVGGGSSSSSEQQAVSSQAISSVVSSVAPSSSSITPSSAAPSSVEPSSVAVSSSSVASSSSIAPSSSSVMNSSVPMSSSSAAALDCLSVSPATGKSIYEEDKSGGLTCTTCHGAFNADKGIFDGSVHKIDPNIFGYSQLETFIAGNMAAGKGKACRDTACETRATELAKYILSKSNNPNWCVGLVETGTSSSSAETSSSVPSSNDDFVVLYAVNAGARVSYTAKNGTVYIPDTGSSLVTGGMGGSTSDPIANTEDDTLYQTERYGTFSYSFPLVAATYDITLHMIESWHGENPGNREFDVEVEGETLVNDFDPLAAAGHDVAYEIHLNGVEVNDGALDILFTPSIPEANVAAITIKGPASSMPEDNGSEGNSTNANRSCSDASNLLICLDFEDVMPGGTPAGFTKSGNVSVVDGQESFTGTRALKLSGSGDLKMSNFPGSHWGRLYYKNTAKPNSIGNYSHTTFVKGLGGGGEFRFVDMVAAPAGTTDDGFYQHLYNTEPNDLSLEGPYANKYDGAWVCVEWSMNVANQEYRFFQNGVEVVLQNGGTATNKTNLAQAIKYDGNMYPMKPVPNTLDSFSIGIQNYQNHQYEFFMDDIAVGTQRIGCEIKYEDYILIKNPALAGFFISTSMYRFRCQLYQRCLNYLRSHNLL